MNSQEKRALEKTLRANGFGQGTAKKIVALVGRHFQGKDATKEERHEDRRG